MEVRMTTRRVDLTDSFPRLAEDRTRTLRRQLRWERTRRVAHKMPSLAAGPSAATED